MDKVYTIGSKSFVLDQTKAEAVSYTHLTLPTTVAV